MEFRKWLVLVVVACFTSFGLLACTGSGSSSSTDEAVTQQPNYLATYHFKINPNADNQDGLVTVTPVVSAYAGTYIPCADLPDCYATSYGINVESANQVFTLGTTMDVDIGIEYTNANNSIEELGIFVNAADATGQVATLTNQDVGTGTIGANLTGSVKPGYVYASGDNSTGPEPFYNNGSNPAGNFYSWVHGTCGKIWTHWTLSEASGGSYSFWADVFGNIAPTDMAGDPRFDANYTSARVTVTSLAPGTPEPGRGGEITQIASGGWFYSSFGYGGKASTLDAQQAIDSPNYDYYLTMQFQVRFDPNVVNVNTTDGTGGNGALKFTTGGGTALLSVNDPGGNSSNKGLNPSHRIMDGWDMLASWGGVVTASNSLGWINAVTDNYSWYNYATTYYERHGRHQKDCIANPGVGDPNQLCGLRGITIDIAYFSMQAVGAAGSSTPLMADTGVRLAQFIANTNGDLGNQLSHTAAADPTNPAWPEYASMAIDTPLTPGSGNFNSEKRYICVQ